MIKDILKNLKPSSTLRINEISQALELEGKKVFKFGFGQSPFQIPDDVVDELKKAAIIVDNRPGCVRISPFFYNNESEIDHCVNVLSNMKNSDSTLF